MRLIQKLLSTIHTGAISHHPIEKCKMNYSSHVFFVLIFFFRLLFQLLETESMGLRATK